MQALLQAYNVLLHLHFTLSPPPQIGYLNIASIMVIILQCG